MKIQNTTTGCYLSQIKAQSGNHRWVINAQTGPFFLAHPVQAKKAAGWCLRI